MATRIVSLSDDIRRSRSLEKKAWFMGRLTIGNLARPSIASLLKHLDGRREVQTVLRLSDKGLSWGEKGSSWRRAWNRTLPFQFVELFALREVFHESSQPHVLICVVSLVPVAREFNCHVFAFRLYDVEDVRHFQVLFQFLTNAGGPVKDTVVGLNNDESSLKTRLAVLPSLDENKVGKSFGDRIRHASKKKDRNLVAFTDPNNNTESEDRTVDHHLQGQVPRSFSDLDTPNDPPTADSWKFHSPQPIRRKDAARSVVHPKNVETVPASEVAGAKAEVQRSVHVKGRNKTTTESWSDDEGERRNRGEFTWTRNSLFGDKVGSRRDAPDPNSAAAGDGLPKAQPRSGDHVRTIIPTQMASGITHDRTVTQTQMEDQSHLERIVTPTRAEAPTSENVEMTLLKGPSGTVRVYVPEFHGPDAVGPKKSLLKSTKDLDPELETPVVDSGRPKKSLSFNPSVLVNGTIGNAFREMGSPDQPGMAVTIHRVFRQRNSSWSDSSNSQRPKNPSSARSRVMLHGFSLPDDTSAVFVGSKAGRIGSTADPSITTRKPHAWINGHRDRASKRDHESINERRQVSWECFKESVEPTDNIPVDVVTEEEDRGHDRRPGMTQSTTHAVTSKLPQQPKGNKTGAAAASQSRSRKADFGRRFGEPPLMYASDSEEWTRSRSISDMLVGQSKRRGATATQAVHQIKSLVDGGNPSTVVEATVTPNERPELGSGKRVRDGEAKRTVVLRERVERGREIDGGEVRRGRPATVREDRPRRSENGVQQFPVAAMQHRHSVPVGRLMVFRRSQSAVDPQRHLPVTYDPNLPPSNGHLPGQLAIRSRSASRPILLSRTAYNEDKTAVGQLVGGQHENGNRNVSQLYLSDQPQNTRLQNGGISRRHHRKSNFF